MGMNKKAFLKLCYVAGSLEHDIETTVKNILDVKGEEFSGNIEEYLDPASVKCIDCCHSVHDMKWCLDRLTEILTEVKVTDD